MFSNASNSGFRTSMKTNRACNKLGAGYKVNAPHLEKSQEISPLNIGECIYRQFPQPCEGLYNDV